MALLAIMLDPFIFAFGVVSYLVGRNWGWLAGLGAVLLLSLALFGAMLSIGGPVAIQALFVQLFGIAAWAGICYGVVWLSSRLRSAAK